MQADDGLPSTMNNAMTEFRGGGYSISGGSFNLSGSKRGENSHSNSNPKSNIMPFRGNSNDMKLEDYEE